MLKEGVCLGVASEKKAERQEVRCHLEFPNRCSLVKLSLSNKQCSYKIGLLRTPLYSSYPNTSLFYQITLFLMADGFPFEC